MLRTIVIRGLLAAALLAPASAACADGGLRTQFGQVIVRGLKIGETYSLNKLMNLPLRVVNTGDADASLKIETKVPTTALVEGYEQVPSLDWVRVVNSTFTVAPNHEAATDLIVTIPNDPKLLGRRFQANIWSHTTDIRAFLVGLESRLLLQIDSTPPNEAELKGKYVDEAVANLDFTVLPIEGGASNVPLGRIVDLRKEYKVSIKLINPNDRVLNFRVRSIPMWESMITRVAGYDEAQNPQWLTPEQGVVKVAGNTIADTSLRLNIPDAPENRGRHFEFIVSFEPLEQKIATRVYYRFMVDTANPPADAGKK